MRRAGCAASLRDTRRRVSQPRGASVPRSNPHPFFTPSKEQSSRFLQVIDVPQAVLSMVELLGVKRLHDADVFEIFLLPSFSNASRHLSRPRSVLYTLRWSSLRSHDGLVQRLKETPFVPCWRPLTSTARYSIQGSTCSPTSLAANRSSLTESAALRMARSPR